MGIDITSTRGGYNDRCKWYKKTDTDRNMKLSADAVAQGVLYTMDTVPLTATDISEGNIKRRQYTITVETVDHIGDMDIDDFVMLPDGYLYRVRNIIIDDKNESKEYSKRPSVKSTLELIR